MAKVYDLDFGFSKLAQVVKSVPAQESLREFMVQRYDFFKDVFLTLTLQSGNFPYINSQDFARFCREIKVIDKTINQSRIDTIVSYVKAKPKGVDLQKLPKQGPLDLSRFEFLEALVRVAIAKYKDLGPSTSAISIQEAFEQLYNENILPNFTPAPWQVFRDEELWTREVNLVFFDNAEGLKKLYQRYCSGVTQKVSYESAIKLLTVDFSIQLDKFDAIYCYGMSLSTCSDLFKMTHLKLLSMSYEEFLEMIARTADVHFKDSEFEARPLW